MLIVWQQMNFIFLIHPEVLIKIDLLEEMLLIDKMELTANPGGDQAGLMLDNTPISFNEGFSKRKALLGTSSTVNCETPLNRYSFFEALEDKLLPNTKIEINFEIKKDDNLIWRAGGNACRVVITRLQLFVPRLVFNSEGSKIYMSEYLKPYK